MKTHKEFDEEHSRIHTDISYFSDIYRNLLNNAVKYTQDGSIRFGYYQEKGQTVFYVSDTGIGIPEEMHEKIFDHFRQVKMDMNRQYEGAGLGLSLAKAYVLALGGDIWVESREDQGSTFSFTIREFDIAEES